MSERLSQKTWPYVLAAAIVILVFLASLVRFGGDPRPVRSAEAIATLAERDDVNVMFVLIDTLRAERLSAYGYERETSPFMQRVAREGIRFDRQLAQSSWTKASMASLWTAMLPKRAGVTRFDELLSADARLPAEIFREQGFRTAGIWRNGWVSGYFGFDQGFEAYDKPASRPPPASVIKENPTVTTVGTDMDVVLAAQEFLRIYGDERWFLYVHLMDLHEYLYDEESALFGTTYSDVYDNSIRRTDWVVEQLFGVLLGTEQLDKTLVILASDHGEAFGERGLEGHARAVYGESTEVPWILSLPFRLESGLVVESRTRNLDIWPTVFELLGLPSMGDVDGRSRVPEILAAAGQGTAPTEPETAISHLDQTWGQREAAPRPTVAVARGPYRYVYLEPEDLASPPREQLFEADAEGHEQEIALEDHPELVAELREESKRMLALEPPWEAETPLEIDEMQLNQLRALGYKIP